MVQSGRGCGWCHRAYAARAPAHFASLGVSAGANVKAVQRMLGHASAAMTLDLYADLFDDDLEAVAERLNVLREGARVARSLHEYQLTVIATAAETATAPAIQGL
jgi:hypothetical protein